MIPMRELQTMDAILDKVLAKAREMNSTRPLDIYLVMGEIAGLSRDEVQQHWNEITRDTIVNGAQLHFRTITAEVQCMSCFQKYHPEDGRIHCAYCGSFGAKILAGEEFYLESIGMGHE